MKKILFLFLVLVAIAPALAQDEGEINGVVLNDANDKASLTLTKLKVLLQIN